MRTKVLDGSPPTLYTTIQVKSAVFAIVPSATQATAIVEELRLSGFLNSDVSVLFPDVEGLREFAHKKSTKAPEGAVIGNSQERIVARQIFERAQAHDIAVTSESALPTF